MANLACFAGASTSLVVKAATRSDGPGRTSRGTKKVVPFGEPSFRDKSDQPTSVKLLSRIEQLRLLSKAEKAGLLSTAEKLGITLSTIEKLGLLSKAEDLGVLSAATNPSTPATLSSVALALLALGPLFVYFVPDDSVGLVVLQAVVTITCVIGGSAAFAASNLVSKLQTTE